MAKRVGVVTIDISAGTAKFLSEVDTANAKLAQFGKGATSAGHATVSSMQASSAAIRLLENPMGNNIRAVERFIALLPGMGTALRMAFPVVGALAFVDVIGRMGKEVYDFYQKIEQAPTRIAAAFREINAPLQLTNDELQRSNDAMANDIAKLEGKPQNNLAIALDDARVAADQLAESLDKDLTALNGVLQKQGWSRLESFGSIFTGNATASTTDFVKRVGGETGTGGWTGEIDQMTSGYRNQLSGTKDPAQIKAIEAAARSALAAKFKAIDDAIAQAITDTNTAQKHESQPHWYDARLELMKYSRQQFGEQAQGAQDRFTGGDLAAQKSAAEIAAAARKAQEEAAKRAAEAAKQAVEAAKRKQEALTRAIREGARLEAEEAKRAGREINAGLLSGLEENARDAERDIQQWLAVIQKTVEAANKDAQEKIKSTGIGTQSNDEVSKLILQQQYGLQIVHTRQQEFEYAVKTAAADEQAVTDRILNLQALKDYQTLNALTVEADQTDLEIQSAKAELLKQQIEHQTRLNELASEQRRQMTNQALDVVSGNLTKLMTGQHTSWGKDMQQAGRSMLQSSLKAMMEHALGKHKPTGTAADPVNVLVGNWPAAGPDPLASLPGMGQLPAALGGAHASGLPGIIGAAAHSIGGWLDGLLGNGGGTAVSSTFTALADGGDVVAGNNYIVGDGGEPEIFSPRMSGTVTPVSKLGAGGAKHYYTIDARGAQLGVENRISRAIEAAHSSAVSSSVRASAERSKRTPRRSS